jgi:hypothetical protein
MFPLVKPKDGTRMDQQLLSLISDEPAPTEAGRPLTRKTEQTIRFVDDARGEIEVSSLTGAQSSLRFVLKPMRELYGPGTGRDSLDPTDETFTPLLLAIEEPIVLGFHENRRLTDAQVSIALDRLCTCPEADVNSDRIAQRIQLNLRLYLSLNDYSRQDVRHALRKVAKSVARHTRLAGPRGYLTFIAEQLRV